MLIKAITIENFLSYSHRVTISFEKGPTIILGQNNTGKSKLFDAFNWTFYDRAYKTRDERWDVTKDWGDELINNYAKIMCKPGETVSATVEIEFIDEEENSYLLTREYQITKKETGDWDCSRDSELSLSKTDSVTSNHHDYYNNDAEDQIRIMFPENLSKYFLFQGESIGQIMSLSNRSAFTNALHDLSRIEVFERARNYAQKTLKVLKKEFNDKVGQDAAQQDAKINLSREIDHLKAEIETLNGDLDHLCKERDLAKGVLDNKTEEMKKFEACAQIIKDLESLQARLDSKNETRASLIESQKKEILENWLYAGAERTLKNFLEFYNKNKIEKKIPEPIRQDFIKEMLQKQKCEVCGSDAPKGSDRYNKISSFISEKSLDKEIELINSLGYIADSTLSKTILIPDQIADFSQKISTYDQELKSIQNKIKAKREELRTVKPPDISEDDLQLDRFTQLQDSRARAEGDYLINRDRVNQVLSKREDRKATLQQKTTLYDIFVEKSEDTREKERLRLAEKVSESTSNFYDIFLAKLISDIENDATKYFEKMTSENQALSGKVKVDNEIKEVYTINENGDRLYNINQANKVSLQISFVAAVLSVSNKFWNTHFPFIADAPISALGGNNKLMAVKTMIDIFAQSIIILKDDSVTQDPASMKNDLVRNLIRTNDGIAHAYELEMQGDTVEQQCTNVRKLK